jgi:hypothetical protein
MEATSPTSKEEDAEGRLRLRVARAALSRKRLREQILTS